MKLLYLYGFWIDIEEMNCSHEFLDGIRNFDLRIRNKIANQPNLKYENLKQLLRIAQQLTD
jgi:hypothetical protein